MGRAARVDVGGYCYHVLNRGNGRMRLFADEADYAAFERVLAEAVIRSAAPGVKGLPGVRLLGFCVMPNHWHLVVWTRRDGDLARFVGWLTLTHTQRWHAHRHSVGGGHVYQGRYKSFIIQQDAHLWAVLRYVERNPLRANLPGVKKAEDWPWSSLPRRLARWRGEPVAGGDVVLTEPPVRLEKQGPWAWLRRVNQPESAAEIQALRRSVGRGLPYGGDRFTTQAITRHALETATRPRGRPKKGS